MHTAAMPNSKIPGSLGAQPDWRAGRANGPRLHHGRGAACVRRCSLGKCAAKVQVKIEAEPVCITRLPFPTWELNGIGLHTYRSYSNTWAEE